MQEPKNRPDDGASVKWTDQAGIEHTGQYEQENDVFHAPKEEGQSGTLEWDFGEQVKKWEEEEK